MREFKNNLKNHMEKLASRDRGENIDPKDIKELMLLILNDNESEKLNFDELMYRVSLVNSIMMSVYLENRYGKK